MCVSGSIVSYSTNIDRSCFPTRYAPPGKHIALLSGEWGYSTMNHTMPGGPYANETTQGKYLPRMFLHNVMIGVNLSVWYDWHDDGTDPSYVEDNFGTVRNKRTGNESEPFQPKPSYLAASALTEHVIRGCPDYHATRTFVVPSGSSCFGNGTCFNHTVCYASYWGCSGHGRANNSISSSSSSSTAASEMIAVWCGSNEGWSTTLSVPASGSDTTTTTTDDHDAVVTNTMTGRDVAEGDGTECFSQYDWLGVAGEGLLCVSEPRGGGAALQVQASNGVTYLVPSTSSAQN
jgi:hypothetical protein